MDFARNMLWVCEEHYPVLFECETRDIKVTRTVLSELGTSVKQILERQGWLLQVFRSPEPLTR